MRHVEGDAAGDAAMRSALSAGFPVLPKLLDNAQHLPAMLLWTQKVPSGKCTSLRSQLSDCEPGKELQVREVSSVCPRL